MKNCFLFLYLLFTVDFNKYKNVKGVLYSLHLDEKFAVVFMTVSHSPQMLLSFK